MPECAAECTWGNLHPSSPPPRMLPLLLLPPLLMIKLTQLRANCYATLGAHGDWDARNKLAEFAPSRSALGRLVAGRAGGQADGRALAGQAKFAVFHEEGHVWPLIVRLARLRIWPGSVQGHVWPGQVRAHCWHLRGKCCTAARREGPLANQVSALVPAKAAADRQPAHVHRSHRSAASAVSAHKVRAPRHSRRLWRTRSSDRLEAARILSWTAGQ